MGKRWEGRPSGVSLPTPGPHGPLFPRITHSACRRRRPQPKAPSHPPLRRLHREQSSSVQSSAATSTSLPSSSSPPPPPSAHRGHAHVRRRVVSGKRAALSGKHLAACRLPPPSLSPRPWLHAESSSLATLIHPLPPVISSLPFTHTHSYASPLYSPPPPSLFTRPARTETCADRLSAAYRHHRKPPTTATHPEPAPCTHTTTTSAHTPLL